jgi:hypothetical protein
VPVKTGFWEGHGDASKPPSQGGTQGFPLGPTCQQRLGVRRSLRPLVAGGRLLRARFRCRGGTGSSPVAGTEGHAVPSVSGGETVRGDAVHTLMLPRTALLALAVPHLAGGDREAVFGGMVSHRESLAPNGRGGAG